MVAGIEKLVKIDTTALDSIMLDCKSLTRIDLLFVLSDAISTILERAKKYSLISYEVGLLGNAKTLDGLPKFENVKTIPDENVPNGILFILTIRLDGALIIRPLNHQTWEEAFLDFFRTKEIDRVIITHPHLQARLVNCPME